MLTLGTQVVFAVAQAALSGVRLAPCSASGFQRWARQTLGLRELRDLRPVHQGNPIRIDQHHVGAGGADALERVVDLCARSERHIGEPNRKSARSLFGRLVLRLLSRVIPLGEDRQRPKMGQQLPEELDALLRHVEGGIEGERRTGRRS
jgi:hypothetical protein